MKRFGLIIVLVAIAAAGILFAIKRATPSAHTAVAALLPRETVAFAHLPDLNRIRDQWHQTDIYQLYREPALQDFLRKPIARMPQRDATAQTLRDLEELQIKDGFVALTSIVNSQPTFVAGFRFRGSQSDAEKIVQKWRQQLVGNSNRSETQEYQQHKIEISGEAAYLFATVYDRDWLFAATDVDQLKAMLDRADGRSQDPQSNLERDENFRAAMAHMPPTYAACLYVQPKSFADKLASFRTQTGSNQQQSTLEQIRSACGAVRFDGGKIRDIWFVGVPKQQQTQRLSRSAAALGTSDTFLYLATLLNPDRLGGLNQPGATVGIAVWLQKVFNVAASEGLTADDWKTAFDLELGLLGDWPASAHSPSIVASLPVKDPARAGKIANALTSAIDEDANWTKIEKDGATYFVMQTPASLFAVAPTIGLSSKLLVVGLDSASVEATLKSVSPGLNQVANYKSAVRTLPDPTNFFAYVDLPTLYSRLDAALRPMLLMAPIFLPGISQQVDVTKLPAPEIVTKHLSPIVSSQRYDSDGYVTESIGPVTLTQFGAVIGVPAFFWWHRGH